jgi:DNA polymerase-3 subunit epsilon
MPIPLKHLLVHGVYDDDVKNAPRFEEMAPKLFKFLFDCDLGGFNSNRFDIPLLAEEFLRAGIDFQCRRSQPHGCSGDFSLDGTKDFESCIQILLRKSLDDAHEALPDALATLEVFEAMLDRYKDVEVDDGKGNLIHPVQNDMEIIHKLSERKRKADFAGHIVFNDQDQPVFNFGKYKNMLVTDVFQKDLGYFSWMMNADFPLYTKKVLKEIKEGTN